MIDLMNKSRNEMKKREKMRTLFKNRFIKTDEAFERFVNKKVGKILAVSRKNNSFGVSNGTSVKLCPLMYKFPVTPRVKATIKFQAT